MPRMSREGLVLGNRAARGRGQATSHRAQGHWPPEHAAPGRWASVKAGTDGVCWESARGHSGGSTGESGGRSFKDGG